MSSFPLLFPWRALTVLPISNLLQRGGGGDVLQKTDGGRDEEGTRRVDWGRGISARLSSFLTEDAQPSVRRQTHVWPSFVQHLTWCEGFSLAMPTCVADDVCVSSVPWLLAWSCRAMLFTSSVPQAALQGGWGIRCKMASDTQHNQGVPAWILYSAFHHSHPLWTDQSRWMRWIRILIECLGAVIKKNDYIFPKCMKKWMDHWGAVSCFGLIHIKSTMCDFVSRDTRITINRTTLIWIFPLVVTEFIHPVLSNVWIRITGFSEEQRFV